MLRLADQYIGGFIPFSFMLKLLYVGKINAAYYQRCAVKAAKSSVYTTVYGLIVTDR